MPNQQKSTDEIEKELIANITADMPAFMDKIFGVDNWFFDDDEQLYITQDLKYKGDGFGFIAFRPDGTYFNGIRPADFVLQ